MELGIKNKIALVTGGGRGIGRAVAEVLVKEGAKVACVSRTLEDLKDFNCLPVPIDLCDEGAPAATVEAVTKEFGGPIDILVNNLGGTLREKDPFCSLESWRRVWRLNFEVAVEINNLVIPAMQNNKWGRIVNVSSISGCENHGPVTYCTAKAALNAYTRCMGRILAPTGVVMIAVAPGAIFTEKGEWDWVKHNEPERFEKYMNERMAIGRIGHLDEISGVIAFLCSQHVSFCIGSLIPVDGGQGRTFFD